MTGDPRAQQRREWAYLYDRIREVLRQFGEEDDYPERKDYWFVNENWGLWQHKIETSNLEMVRPVVVKSLQKLLQGYPNWDIAIAVASPEKENAWPAMGLTIRDDEIIDGLQRQYFPKEFQTIVYEGSRPQGSRFEDILFSNPGPF
jgi:hypothetical protein